MLAPPVIGTMQVKINYIQFTPSEKWMGVGWERWGARKGGWEGTRDAM